jgi:hypothetical protein
MRIGALHSLKIGHCTETSDLDQKFCTYKIIVYAGTREKYITLCTPECYSAIQNYLDYRKRCGENLHEGSPLIREQFNKDNPFTINSPRFVSEKRMEHLIDNVLRKSGTRKPRKIHLSHGFRKFFMTQCEKSGMKSINIKMILGHDIGVSGHYYRPAEADLLEDYMTHAADALTISDEHRLKEQVEMLEGKQSQQIDELKQEINGLKQLLNPVHPGIPGNNDKTRETWWKLYKAQHKERGWDISNWPDKAPRHLDDK